MSDSDIEPIGAEREQIEDDIERLNLALQEEEVNLESDEELARVVVEDCENEPRPGPSGLSSLSATVLTKDDVQLDDISNFQVVDSCRGIPVTTETCLALNRAYQEILLDFLHQIEVALTDNRNKQYTLEEGLNENAQIKNTKTGGKPLTSFATPYFKDANDHFPPENDDHRMKVILKEHKQDFRPPVPWYRQQREMLEKAVVRETLQARIRPLMNRKEIQCEKFLEADKNDKKEVKKEIEERIEQIDKDIEKIKNMSKAELLKDIDVDLIDWLKIANSDFQGKKDKDDCYKMWNNVMRPGINKEEWIPEEVELLKDLVAEHKMRDWVTVADKLGTGRTAFQCLQYYQQNLNEAYSKREWIDEEDELLAEVVENCRTENRTPWHQVSYFIEGRSAAQCMTRWNQIDPQLKHGKWSEEEDCLLLSGTTLYGTKDWTKIASVVPGRNPIQCRDRYVNCLDPNLKPPSIWTYEEDKALLKSVVKHTMPDKTVKWTKVATEIKGRTDHMVLSRYKRLMTWKAKCEWIDSLDAETKRILGNVTVQKHRLPPKNIEVKGKRQRLNITEKRQNMAFSLAEEACGVQREDYLKQERDKDAGEMVVPRPPLCYRYSPRNSEYAWKQKLQLKKLVEDHLHKELQSPASLDKMNLPAKTASEFQPYFNASRATKRSIAKILQNKNASSVTVSQLLDISRNFRNPEKRGRRKKQRIQITKQIIDVLSRKNYIDLKSGKGKAGRPRKYFLSHPYGRKPVFEDQRIENVNQLTTVSSHLMMTALEVNGRKCLENAARWDLDLMPENGKTDMAFLKKLFPPIPAHLQKKTTTIVPVKSSSHPATPVSEPSSLNITPVITSEATVNQDGSDGKGRQSSVADTQAKSKETNRLKRKSKVLPKMTATLESKKKKLSKDDGSINKEDISESQTRTEIIRGQETALVNTSNSEQTAAPVVKVSGDTTGATGKLQTISVKSLSSIQLKPGQHIIKLGGGGSVVKEGEISVLKTKTGDIKLKPGQRVVKIIPQSMLKAGQSLSGLCSKPQTVSQTPKQVTVSSALQQVSVSQTPKQVTVSPALQQVSVSQTPKQVTVSPALQQVSVSQTPKQVTVSQTPKQVTVSPALQQVSVSQTPKQVTVSPALQQVSVSQTPKQVTVSQTKQISMSSTPKQGTVSLGPKQKTVSQTAKPVSQSSNQPDVKQNNGTPTSSHAIILPKSGNPNPHKIPILPPSVKSLEGFGNLLLQRKTLTNKAGRHYNARYYQRRVSQLVQASHLSACAEGRVDEQVDVTLRNTFQVFKDRGSKLYKSESDNKTRQSAYHDNSVWLDPLEAVRNSVEYELLKKRFQGLFVWPALLSTVEPPVLNKVKKQDQDEVITITEDEEVPILPKSPSVSSNMTPTQAAVIKQSSRFFNKIKNIIKKYPRKTYACAHSKTYYKRKVKTKEWKEGVVRKRQLALKLRKEGVLEKKMAVRSKANKHKDIEKRTSVRLANKQTESTEKSDDIISEIPKKNSTNRKIQRKKRSTEADEQKTEKVEHVTPQQDKHSSDSADVKRETTDDSFDLNTDANVTTAEPITERSENRANSTSQPAVEPLTNSSESNTKCSTSQPAVVPLGPALLQNLMMLQQGGLLPVLTQPTGPLLSQEQKDGTSNHPGQSRATLNQENKSPIKSTSIPDLSGHVLLAVPMAEFMKGMGKDQQGMFPLSFLMNPGIPQQQQTSPAVTSSGLPVIATPVLQPGLQESSNSNVQKSNDQHGDSNSVTEPEKQGLDKTQTSDISQLSHSTQSTDTETNKLSSRTLSQRIETVSEEQSSDTLSENIETETNKLLSNTLSQKVATEAVQQSSNTLPQNIETEANQQSSNTLPQNIETEANQQSSNTLPQNIETEANQHSSNTLPQNKETEANQHSSNTLPQNVEIEANQQSSNTLPQNIETEANQHSSNTLPQNVETEANQHSSNTCHRT